MPAISRLGDSCTGHDLCGSRPCDSASPDVYANSINVHRLGDSWAPHGCLIHPPHGSVLAAGWPTVFANNLQVSYIGAPVACGSSVAEGSNNVFVGEL